MLKTSNPSIRWVCVVSVIVSRHVGPNAFKTLINTVPLSEETNIDLLDQVIQDQTDILHQVFGQDFDVSTIPQIWALC